MKFLPYVEGKEPYMPPNKSECVTFFWDCGDVPIFGIATYFKKGEKVTEIIRNFEGSEDMSVEERILASLFLDDAERTIEKSGLYTMEECDDGNVRYVKVPDPIAYWSFLEVPLSTGRTFVDASIEERMGVMNTLENMIRILDKLEKAGLTAEEQIIGLKEWTKGIVCDVENGAKAKAMIVSTLLD